MGENVYSKGDLNRLPSHQGFVPHDEGYGSVVEKSQKDFPGRDSNTFVRFYDVAVINWLRSVLSIKGVPINCVVSMPNRALADYDRLFKSRLQEKEESVNDQKKPPLPFASIIRGKIGPRRWGSSVFPVRNLAHTSDRKKTVYTRRPSPINLSYSVDLWSKYEAEHVWLLQRVLSVFQNKTAVWTTKYPYQDAEQLLQVPIRLAGDFSDNSEAIAANDVDAERRWTLDLEVEGWMFHDLLFAPTFLVANFEFINAYDDEVLLTKTNRVSSLSPVPIAEQEDYPTTAPE